MWRVSLSYLVTRIVFFGVVIFAVNKSLQPTNDKLLPPLFPFGQITQKLVERIAETTEVQQLEAVVGSSALTIFKKTHNPFIWISFILKSVGFSSVGTVVFLSNLFFIMGLFELFTLLSRLTTIDVAIDTPILLLLWPTSYELSLGSSISLSMWLSLFAIRWAMNDRWIPTGIALGLLGLLDPIVFGVLGLVAYYFWFFSRNYEMSQKLKRVLYVFGPLGLALVWNAGLFRGIENILSGSAIINIFRSSQEGSMARSSLVQSYFGQLIAIFVLLVGVIAAFVSNPTFLHRFTPAYFLFALLLCSPIGTVASRVPLAALCLEGVASLPIRPVLQGLKLTFFGLSAYELLVIFGNF